MAECTFQFQQHDLTRLNHISSNNGVQHRLLHAYSMNVGRILFPRQKLLDLLESLVGLVLGVSTSHLPTLPS